MRNLTRTAALVAALICTAVPAAAATPGEFYASLLRRGVAAFDGGRFDEATQHLRLAAFGLIENIEQYQTAHAYLAATYDRTGQQDRARDSVRRIAQAERVQARFAALKIPAPVRATVERLAVGVLTPAEISGLRGTAVMPPSPPPQPLATRTTGTAVPAPATSNPPAATTTTTTTTTTPPVTVDRIVVEEVKPAPATVHTGTNHNPPATTTPATKPPASTTATTTTPQQPATTTQPRVAPPSTATTTTTPATTPARPPLTYTPAERAARFAAAERALETSNLPEARRLYSELLASQGLDRDAYIRLAEGFYRSRHFAGALAAFERAGGLRRGEEPYRYYVAVALYETGQYERARRELASALPYIEVTPDVARYRTKIQSAIQ